MKRFFSLAIMFCLLTGFAACQAANHSSNTTSAGKATEALTPTNGLDPVNKVSDELALRGYDTVAYFQEGKAVEGSGEFSFEYSGAKWLFSKAEHRDLFAREPQKYAPQYGGYCAWAVGHGYTANGDPQAWKIVEGKLYLNYNEKVKTRWEQDQANYIRQGDENWLRFLESKPEHKG